MRKGYVIWLTGLSGSGKTTIAVNLNKVLMNTFNINTILLDGDILRKGLNKDLGYSRDDRQENIRRVSEIIKILIDNGQIVIASFISPLNNDRKIAKEIIGNNNFIEIFVKCPIDICKERDPKGLYKKAVEGRINNFTGISASYEEPINSDLIIETNIYDINHCIECIIIKLITRGCKLNA